MIRRVRGNLCVNCVRVWVHPAFALIFHIESGFARNFAPKVALHNPQREIDARGKSTGTSEIGVLNES